MFFEKKIINISRNKLVVSRVNQKKIKTTTVLDWNDGNLTQQLNQIKDQFGNSFRVLLDDSYVYSTHVYLPANSYNVRSVVQDKAQELIPEDLSQTIWDFKEEPELHDNNQKNGRYYQILAINKSFYDQLSVPIKTLGLKIEAIEPISQSLARLLAKNQNEPFFIIYKQSHYVLITCFGDIVINAKTIDSLLSLESITQYLNFIEQKYGLKPTKILWSNQETLPEFINTLGIKIEEFIYQPEVGMWQKTDLKGNDSMILNLNNSANQSPEQTNLFFLIKMVAGLTVGSLIIITIAFKTNNKTVINQSKANPSIVQPTKSQPTKISPINSRYSITILNGNGTEGAAGEAEALLDQQEYKVVNLDNADNYDFEQTVLQYKKQINSQFINKLDKLLQTQYDVIIDDNYLDSSAKSDIIIIIGKN